MSKDLAPFFTEYKSMQEENTKLKELVKELRKALQKETPALRVENAKLKTKVFLIKGLLDKWLPEFDCYNDTLTSQFCKEARQVLGEE